MFFLGGSSLSQNEGSPQIVWTSALLRSLTARTWKKDGGKTYTFLLGFGLFSEANCGYVKLQGCKYSVYLKAISDFCEMWCWRGCIMHDLFGCNAPDPSLDHHSNIWCCGIWLRRRHPLYTNVSSKNSNLPMNQKLHESRNLLLKRDCVCVCILFWGWNWIP